MNAPAKKILIISLGSIGQRHLRNTRAMLPDAQIAVYRQHTSTNGKVPEGADLVFDDFQAAQDFRPDAVIVSSPAHKHIEMARPFAAQGAHLFIEKPLAHEAAALVDFKESSSFVMVGYVLRFLPALNFIRDLLADGTYGTVRKAHVQVGQWLPDWRPDSDYRHGVSAQKKLGGGALLELSHELDYATWLFGMPDHILCSASRLSDLEIDVEDNAQVILEYGAGGRARQRVVVEVDFLQRVANMAIQIVTSKATIKADLIKETVHVFTPDQPEGKNLNAPRVVEGNELYLRQFDFFFAKAFDDYRPRFKETSTFDQYANLRQAAQVLELVDAAKEANEKGRRLSFDAAKIERAA